jgi:hypothetical protein
MRLFVTIASPAFDRLRDLARVERRTARAQASVLLERLLHTEKVPGELLEASEPDRSGRPETEGARPC